MNRESIRLKLTAALCSLLPIWSHAQDISQIAKSDPLIITGAVGTQNTYHSSTNGYGYAAPWSSMFYANLNVRLYGMSMPFSISYSNTNWDYNYPYFSLSLSPSYKNWTGYIGQSSMNMSTYVMNMGFNGVGVEYADKRFRSGLFYGVLRKAINDDPTDPMARSPQMKRLGWGFKVGYGSSSHFLDLYLLRAYDCPSSVDEHWRSRLGAPQENIVVGVRGGTAPFRWLSFTANAAVSAFNTDKDAPKISTEDTQKFETLFTTRYSSLARFAGDVSANLNLGAFNASLSYRMIQPDYTSLGTYYMSNNYHSLGITLSTSLLNRIALSATFNGQKDNLTKKQLYTTKGYVYGVYASTRLDQHLSLSAGFNGYLQDQGDGTMVVTDSSRVHRVMSSLTFSPSWMTSTENFDHMVTLSTAYTSNKDLNDFSNGESDVKSLSLGLGYDIGVKPWGVNFILSANHQESKGYKSKYRSDIGSLGVSRSFLKEKNLNLSLTGSLCYNEVVGQSKSLSMGGNMSCGFTVKDVHVFSAQASLYKYGDVNLSKVRSGLDDTDVSVSLSYVYTFTLLDMKRKAEKKQ